MGQYCHFYVLKIIIFVIPAAQNIRKLMEYPVQQYIRICRFPTLYKLEYLTNIIIVIFFHSLAILPTGRVSLQDPNIQNVPNDFEIIPTPQLLKKAGFGRNDSWKNQTISEILTPYASILNVEDVDKTSLLVRYDFT